jgi:hypothetical protein
MKAGSAIAAPGHASRRRASAVEQTILGAALAALAEVGFGRLTSKGVAPNTWRPYPSSRCHRPSHPPGWTAQMTRRLIMNLQDAGTTVKRLISDRDGKYNRVRRCLRD